MKELDEMMKKLSDMELDKANGGLVNSGMSVILEIMNEVNAGSRTLTLEELKAMRDEVKAALPTVSSLERPIAEFLLEMLEKMIKEHGGN